MQMKLVICGSRSFTDYTLAREKVLEFIEARDASGIEIVSGGCDVPGMMTYKRKSGKLIYGADGLAERLAEEMGWPLKTFDPDWSKYGPKDAGVIRNAQMSVYGTHCMAFWDGNSRGTRNMIDLARLQGLEVKVINFLKLSI